MDNSQLAKGLFAIPLLQFGISKASAAYHTLRGYNALTIKSLGWAETATGAVLTAVGQNSLTRKGLSLVGDKLEALDSLAARSLADLETKVPAIKTQPEEVMPAVKEKVDAVRTRVVKSSEWILLTKPAQTSCDIAEFFLTRAASTLDKVLPPKDGKGDMPSPPDKKEERAMWLMTLALAILMCTKDRVVEHLKGRVKGGGAPPSVVVEISSSGGGEEVGE